MKAIRRVIENWKIGRINMNVSEAFGERVFIALLALPILLLIEMALPSGTYSALTVFAFVVLLSAAHCTLLMPYMIGRRLRRNLDAEVFNKIKQYALK